jgi:hypothetical protein
MSPALAALAGASLAVALAGSTLPAQQVMDTAFVPRLRGAPAYPRGKGPVVLIDEAHNNFHTASGRYRPFGKLLEADGFVVRPNAAPFDSASLSNARVLVIANAVSARNRDDWRLPSHSAFNAAEIAAVTAWVRRGGSLLLIADHLPFAGAADSLASALGVFFANGFALPAAGAGRRSGEIVFRRGEGLVRHPITDGRSASERVDSVVSFTGSAFRLGESVDHAAALMRLPAGTRVRMPVVAWQFSDSTAEFRGDGMLQGAVFQFGRGRVGIFGEAAMFSAQVTGPQRLPMGMNAPYAAGNPQFVLNTLHWMAGLLTDR